MIHKKVHFVSQLGSMDCGIACLTMIFNYFGCKVDIVDIGAYAHIGKNGISLSQMKMLAEQFGFVFTAYQYNYEQNYLVNYLPAILCTDSHYVVVDKAKKSGGYIVFDPARGRKIVDFSELSNRYKNILVSIKPSTNVKKVKRSKSDINLNIFNLIIGILLMIMAQIVILLVPMVVQKLIDGSFSLGNILVLVFLIMCSHFLFSYFGHKILLNTNIDFFRRITFMLLHKIFRLDISFFEWHSADNIGNRFSGINQLNDILINGLANIIIQSITSLVCLYVMASLSLYLTVTVIVISVIHISIMIVLNNKNVLVTEKYFYTQNIFQKNLVDTLENIIEIRCMGLDESVKINLINFYNQLIDKFKEKNKISNLMNSYLSTINLIFPLIAYIFGHSLIVENSFSVGTLIAYVILVGYFTEPFTTVVLMLPSFNSIKEVILCYKELMFFRENSCGGNGVCENFKNVKMDSVSCRYSNGQGYALDDISLDIKRGERIAIMGLSASEKSILIKIILNVVDIEEGFIKINNRNIKEISKDQIYGWFSLVTQDPICLNASIRKNIDIAGDFSDDDIWEALEIAELKEDILKMPLRLNTLVCNDGQNTDGLKQRIAIARALINNTEVIIFDEAMSNLDQSTEKKIYKNLERIKKTQIVITHKLSSVSDFNRIYVLDKGKIVESEFVQ